MSMLSIYLYMLLILSKNMLYKKVQHLCNPEHIYILKLLNCRLLKNNNKVYFN